MPVQRYRDVADIPSPPRSDPREPDTYRRIRELWQFTHRTLPPLFRPGVYRFRSIEESQLARERALIERMRSLHAKRIATPNSRP